MPTPVVREGAAGLCPDGETGSVDRGQEATGGAIEGEPTILPGRALTQTREPLHVAPDRTGIRLVRFRQRVRLGGLLLRQFESLHGRINDRVACRPDFLGRGPQEHDAIVRGVCVEGRRGRSRATSSTRPESTHPRAGAGSRRRAGSPR